MVAAAKGVGWGEVVLSRVFCGSFNASTAKSEKRKFSLNAPNNVFRCWVRPFWVSFPSGQIFLPFTPKTFFNGPNKAIILHGSEMETRLMDNDSSVKFAH